MTHGQLPLARLATYINGRAFKPEDFTPGGRAVIRIRQLVDPTEAPDTYDGPVEPHHLIRDGDLIFSWSGSLAVRRWDRGEAILNQHLFRVVEEEGIDRGWLRWALESTIPRLEGAMHGSAMTHITRRVLKDIRVMVPEAEHQRAIAEYLDRHTTQIDQLIAKKADLASLLSYRTRSRTDHLLTAVGDQVERIPLRAVLRPRQVSGLPQLEVLSVFREHGVVPKSSREGNYNKTPDDLNRYQLVEPGDVVVNKMKAWQGSLGVSDHRGIVSPDYLVCQVTHPMESVFLHALLRSPRMISEYIKRSTGIRPAQWRLYWQDLKEIRIPLPPVASQKVLGDEIAHSRKLELRGLEALQIQMALLRERRQALIAAAVAGQMGIPVAA